VIAYIFAILSSGDTAAMIASVVAVTAAWFEMFGRIFAKDRSKGLVKPRMNYLQVKIQETIDRFEVLGYPVRIIGLKPRQKGSTTYFVACVYTWLRRKIASAVLIGGQFAQVKEAWAMLKTYHDNDKFPHWKNTGQINTKEGSWSHGSKIIAETAGDVLAGIGGTHQVLHAFEVARWAEHEVANSAEVLANILKSVPLLPDTLVILESTAEGASGDFHARFVKAIDAEDFISGELQIMPGQYVRVFAPWFEFDDSAMRLTEEQKEHVRDTLDQDPTCDGEAELMEAYGSADENDVIRLGTAVKDFDVWEQLAWRRLMIETECKGDKNNFDRDYPHSWRTAFQKSGTQRFNTYSMAAMRRRMKKRPAPTPGIFEEIKGRKNRYAFRPTTKDESKVTIFEKPIRGCRYILCVDPMTGETQTGSKDPDWHGVFVLRAGYYDAAGRWLKAVTAARVNQCRWDIDVLELPVWQLACHYGNGSGCKIAIEMNMDRGLTELLKLRGADLYQRELFNQREQKTSVALGYLTNVKSREVLVERLAKMIRETEKTGEGIEILCPTALEQCENFVRKSSGKSEASEGYKDDDVLAIALGATVIEHATTYNPPVTVFDLPPDLRNGLPGRPGSIGGQFS
jgi:hypothetical protein